MTKLAIHGGPPARSTPIYYGRQHIDEDDCTAVREVLLGDLITTGPRIAELEKQFCAYTGAKYAVFLANGTAALHAACHAAGITHGDEVITSAITFAASANCALYCGATPVFADIDEHTLCISPDSIRRSITSRTKAVVAVDFTGQAAQLDEIREICTAHKLMLIEDAAHSLGTSFQGNMVGSIADLTTFSFHPVKTVTGGEGGAVTTNDEGLYRKLMLFRTHGITRDPAEFAMQDPAPWYYDQVDLGYNYRLTDFQAALITSQMKKLPGFIARRREIVQRYNEAFCGVPEPILQKDTPGSHSVKHLYILQFRMEMLNTTQRELFDALRAENVVCNVHYIPVYWLSYYQAMGHKKGACPNAEQYYARALSIPLYPAMTDEDVNSVIEAVKKVVAYYRVAAE